jgi:prevent-host-death family protein
LTATFTTDIVVIIVIIYTTTKPIAAQEARRRFGELLDKAFYRRESFVVERAGEAKAAIVPLAEYDEMLRIKQEAKKRFFALVEEIQKRTSANDPKQVQRAIDEAIENTKPTSKTK